MQLYALKGSNPIAAAKAERGKDYLCPECASTVRLRGGPSRQTHFYHLFLTKKCRQHQKSLEHLQLQLKLFELIGPDAQIECPFPDIRRIADVAWHSKKIVFEIQRSPIPLEEAQSRNGDYQTAGYHVIWILHDKQFNKATLSAAESHLRTTPCYFTNIDKTGNGIIYDQFEVIKGIRRLFKGPPLKITPTKILSMPSIAAPDIALPHLLLDRLANWKCYAAGDLLHRILKEGNLCLSAKKMTAIEAHLNRENRIAHMQRLPTLELIAKSYRSIIDWAIRNFST